MIKKRFFKTKDTCKVTFELPKSIEAKSVTLVGDFNNWNDAATPLKKVKGTWKVALDLAVGQEFQYRYFVNGSDWHNDWEADKYVANNVDGDNSVIVTTK